ncbi:MAG: gas vesicle protein GvpD P-loop domain-containing protein [Thermoplasmata archaeon]
MHVRGIPEDLLAFFRGTGGHSLIVKGSAGTGKTTLALQLIEELDDVPGSYYLSLRVSDTSLYRQFPWLQAKVRESELMKIGQRFLRSFEELSDEEQNRIRQARSLLREVSEEEVRVTRVDRTELNKLEGRVEMGQEGDDIYEGVEGGEVTDEGVIFDLHSDLPEMDLAYEAVDKNLPRKSLLVIDSIDALSERYGIHPAKLINTIQKDLVENSNTNVVYILEQGGPTKLDYLGDGVVDLRDEEVQSRRLRILAVDKLRGREIAQHKHVFTLKDGRVTAFPQGLPETTGKRRRWKAHKDLNGRPSTGHEELDALIGGLERGGILALQVDARVPDGFVDPLLIGLVANFVRKQRGVAYVPPRKVAADDVREALQPYVGAPALDRYVRVFEAAPLGTLESSTSALQMEGTDVETDLRWSTLQYHLGDARRPLLSLLAFDTLEAVYGPEVASRLTGHLAAIRKSKDVFVGLTAADSPSAEALANLASVHLRIENVEGSILLYGEKPYTPFHSLSYDPEEGFSRARLIPVV